MSTHQEPRQPAALERVPHFPHVDLIHGAAAEQLGITVHVDTRRGVDNRATPPPGFAAAIAAAVQGVVDDLMPFPSDAAPAEPVAQAPVAVAKSPRKSRPAKAPRKSKS